MITVKIPIDENEPSSLTDVKHANTLRIHGVPMRGGSLAKGVEAGVLAYSERDGERTYTWYLEDAPKPKKRLLERFSKQFRVRRFESIGATWYEVQEKSWYWPFWDSWSVGQHNKGSEAIRYPTLYLAERAIRFYQRNEEPSNSVVSHL